MIHEILKILDTTDLPELEKQRITTDLLRLFNSVKQSEQLVCDVCGSTDVIEAPHMGKNCNRCHPL